MVLDKILTNSIIMSGHITNSYLGVPCDKCHLKLRYL